MFMHTTSSKSAQGERTTDEDDNEDKSLGLISEYATNWQSSFTQRRTRQKTMQNMREMSKDKDFHDAL